MLKTRLEKFNDKVVTEDLILLYNIKNIAQLNRFDQLTISCTSNKFVSSESYLLECFCKLYFCFFKYFKVSKAYHSIAAFNIREKDILGLKINLTKKNVFPFLDKLLIFTGQELPKQEFFVNRNDESLKINIENKTRFSSLYDRSMSNTVNENLYLADTFTIKKNQGFTIGIFPEVSFLLKVANKSNQSFSSSTSTFFSKFSFLCLIKTFYKQNKIQENGVYCNLQNKKGQNMHFLKNRLLSLDHKNQMKKVLVSAFQFPTV